MENEAQHMLRLDQIAHPHTAECVKTDLTDAQRTGEFHKNRILTVITDNGSNMIAAFKPNESNGSSSSEEESSETSHTED